MVWIIAKHETLECLNTVVAVPLHNTHPASSISTPGFGKEVERMERESDAE